MSEPIEPLTGPPQAYVSHSVHGSVGPVIGVLFAIAILGAMAVVIGRFCSGRRVIGQVQYDVEGWVETKCSSCINGHVDSPHHPPPEPEPCMSSSSGEEETLRESNQEARRAGQTQPEQHVPHEDV